MQRTIAIVVALVLAGGVTSALAQGFHPGKPGEARNEKAQVGPRPFYLVADMEDGELKDTLESCERGPFKRTDFSIGHRGAALQFPEHTRESYEAAARMGAGIVECDVTFTKDRELVCRHSQCDLHTTTNILAIPELAAKCSVPFTPADPVNGTPAQAQCCTSDITLAEFKRLKGKMDAFNPNATTVEEYMDATASWRTDLYSGNGTLMTHAIEKYVENEAWQVAVIQEAVDELERGEADLADHEDVTKWLNSWGSDNEAAPPACK
jgi:predicted transcriptional regulator